MDENDNVEENGTDLQESDLAELAQKSESFVTDRLAKNAKAKAAKQSLLKVLGPILIKLGFILVIIIVIVGIAMFLVSMPGLAMEKLKQMLTKAGNSVAALFGADTTAMVDDSETYEVLDYLNNMGYDLKSYGFLTEYADLDEEGNCLDDKDDGVRYQDGKISEAKSDYIMTYIMSDNYIYTIKNKNLVAKINSDSGFFEKIFGRGRIFVGKLGDLFLGPFKDISGYTDSEINTFGKGMLVFYYDTGEVGVKKTPVNFYSVWDYITGKADVKVDAASKKMQITKTALFNFNKPLEFSLDGWIGRYGMPLEFLLSVHLTTLKPDLCMDMVTAFPTNVNIYLHELSGDVAPVISLGSGKTYTGAEINDSILEIISELRSSGINIGTNIEPCTCTVKATNEEGTIIDTELTYDPENGCFMNGDEVYDGEPTLVHICDRCGGLVNRIGDVLHSIKDKKYEAYQPYIASVTDHWFRNVYYVINNNSNTNLVDYDYEFESLYKERWTLYETDENGEYILYELNNDGSYKKDGNGNPIRFNGTEKEAKEQKISVAKKAKTLDNYNVLKDDLDWTFNDSNGIWSAYEESSGTTSSLQKVEIDETKLGEELQDLKDKFYVKMNLAGNIVQKGEGQRGETNEKIKEMFLNKLYFTYDGGAERAEAITKLRKKVAEKAGSASGTWYQAVPNEQEYLDLSTEVNGKIVKVSDCVGSVSRIISKANDSSENKDTRTTQELLDISSMLENIHTADADYISRDFKELIVELGYYTKEELTDTTPRLLQWLVPKTGSYGYPKRSIDKNENEYGTMIHSKGDIDEARRILIKPSGESNAPMDTIGYVDTYNSLKIDGNYALTKAESKKMLTSFDGEQTINTQDLVGTSSGSFKGTTFLETAKNCWEYIVDSDKYSYGGANIPITDGSTVDCSAFVSWCIYEHGYEEFAGSQHDTVKLKNTNWNEQYGWEEIPVEAGEDCTGKLQPGDILVRDNGGRENGHTQIIVSVEGGDVLTYDCGGPDHWTSDKKEGHYSPFASGVPGRDWAGKIIRIDSINDVASPYVGYNGNEAVVSPVTGILLEYGTYDENDKDDILGEEYRTNIDYKYDTGKALAKSVNNEEGTEIKEEAEDTSSNNVPVDKVGYAKILVLDNKTYSIFEKSFGNELSRINNGESFVNSNGKLKEKENLNKDTIKDWGDKDKTLYGYKEFAEVYEKSGIAGYIVYIDGFVCEYPDKSKPTGDEDSKDEEFDFTPDGHIITFNDFKNITYGNISSKNKTNDKDDNITEYKKDDEYKLASKKVTERLNAEATVKDDATPTFYTGGTITLKLNEKSKDVSYDGIFIKEGTVLGRTMTDYELIEKRGNEFGTYEELRGKKDDSSDETEIDPHIIGNYLRIQMYDSSRSNVENVEDYLKLDEKDGGKKLKILDDFDVTDASNFPTLEQFLIMFDDCPIIKEKAQAFMEMQEKYGINAAYAAVVTLVESSGGTNWAAIDPSTHNWFSIKGNYNGKSLNGWRDYPSFEAAIDDFGDLMTTQGIYVDKGNHFVSQIGPIYCEGDEWAGKVNKFLKERYEKVLGGS